MEVYLTRHARNRMRLYAIEHGEVEETVVRPEHVVLGEFGRQHAWKRRAQGAWLRVTFKDEAHRRIVITVTPKLEAPGGHHAH